MDDKPETEAEKQATAEVKEEPKRPLLPTLSMKRYRPDPAALERAWSGEGPHQQGS
jgi:hypothetical protein